jgi:nucleotide-binding universal stress UspA family protein
MHDYRRILALVDFSESGTAVARRALKLARLGQTELAFLHLIEPDPGLDGGYPSPSGKACQRDFEQAALRRLAFMAANLGAGEAELMARYGRPRDAFANGIAAWNPDLVVAGDDPGYLGGRHDLLTLGRSTNTGKLKRILHQFMAPAGLLGGA